MPIIQLAQERKMEAKLRSDRKVNPTMREYRILSNEKCRILSGHCGILDRNGNIAQVKITSVKTWKRNNDIEVNCKYGMYEYFTIRISDTNPNTELIELL